MQRAAYLLFVVLLFLSTPSSAYTIVVNYPSHVLMGQPFTVTFGLETFVLNSTRFEYVTPGTKVVNASGGTAYWGPYGFWLVDRVNLTNSSIMIVSFEGKVLGKLVSEPGIVLYSKKMDVYKVDNGQANLYSVLVSWNKKLWVYSLNRWNLISMTIPAFNSGYYEVVFKNVDGYVYVYSIKINSSTYLVNIKTDVPWNNISYIGIRLDNNTVIPESFSVVAYSNAYYEIYLNGKEYASGYTGDGMAKVTLAVYSPTVINISFPQYGLSKVIVIPQESTAANLVPNYLRVPILVLAALVMVLTVWRDVKKRR